MKKWVTSLPAKVIEGLIVVGVIYLCGQVLGDMPIWVGLVAALVAGVVGYGIGNVRRAGSGLYPFYAEHIRDTLETLQKVLAGQIQDVDTDNFVERGILAPARYWLRHGPDEDVRLMVIAPKKPDKREFELIWEAGHSLEAREKFTLEVAGSFAGFAYTSGETQWTDDVENDDRWRPHPKARPGRAYGSLVAVPIRAGDEVVGVLSVISTDKGAFTRGEIRYIEILGSLVNVVWGLADTDGDTSDGPGDESGEELGSSV